MKCRIAVLITAFILAVSFVSCRAAKEQSAIQPSPAETVSSNIYVSPSPTVPTPSMENGNAAETPQNTDHKAESEAVFVPGFFDGSAYISLTNQNCSFFENDSLVPSVAFKIISTEEIGKDRIKIRVPIQTEYKVDISDATEEFHTAAKDGAYGAFEFSHFLMLQKPNWSMLSEIRENENALIQWQLTHHAGETSWDIIDPEEIALNQKVEEGLAFLEQYREAWKAFSDSDIPEFYVYFVNITFLPLYEDASVDHIDLTLGDKTITVPFGEWRFYQKTPDTIPAHDSYGLRQEMPAALTIGGTYLDNGYGMITDAFSFTVGRDDLTVTGTQVCGTDCEVLGAHVRVLTNDQETVSDYYWDLHTPLDFKAGQTVSIDVIVYQERLKQYEFNGTAYLVMEYEINGRAHSMTVPCFLRRTNDTLETYFAVFEKQDLSEVYPYLHGGSSYIPDFPESWRKER